LNIFIADTGLWLDGRDEFINSDFNKILDEKPYSIVLI
jgi:hypothetical protein